MAHCQSRLVDENHVDRWGYHAVGCSGMYLRHFNRSFDVVPLYSGVGACTPVVVAYAIIADRYQGAAMYSMIGLVNACISIFMSLAPIAGGLMSIGVERKLCGCRGDHRSGGTAGIVVPAGNEERKTPFDLKAIVGSYARLTASFQFMRLSLIPSLFFAAYMVFIASSAFLYRETFAFSLSAFVVHFLLSWRHFQSPASFPPVLSPHLVAIGALRKSVWR